MDFIEALGQMREGKCVKSNKDSLYYRAEDSRLQFFNRFGKWQDNVNTLSDLMSTTFELADDPSIGNKKQKKWKPCNEYPTKSGYYLLRGNNVNCHDNLIRIYFFKDDKRYSHQGYEIKTDYCYWCEIPKDDE